MLRWVAASLTFTVTAVCLGLLEPALAASDRILPLLVFFRAPAWLTSFFVHGRTRLAS
jgi:hypothetical protein